jgi:hypothetical protein
MVRFLARLAALPLRDLLRGQRRCVAAPADLGWLLAGLLAGWWIYVPLHELLHALACLGAGGRVWRLELSPLYGGSVLADRIPWVASGGEYAGRLAGFDAAGSDLVYLATDLGPFVLTLLPGVFALRRAARVRRPLLFGMAAPLALAPLLSLGGDAYEIGAILTTRLPLWTGSAWLLRGDDVVRVAARLAATRGAPWGGFAAALLVGVVWAWTVYGLGAAVARGLGEPAVGEDVAEGGTGAAAGVEKAMSSIANCQ